VSGWQPITSAPRDGTKFDVWIKDDLGGWREVNLSLGPNGKLYREGRIAPIDLPRWPTHWMPRPSAPDASA
jgi:hypothetical protein